MSIKYICGQTLKESTVKEFESWTKEYDSIEIINDKRNLFVFIAREHKEIRNFEEKLDSLLQLFRKTDPEKEYKLLEKACFYIEEKLVYLILQKENPQNYLSKKDEQAFMEFLRIVSSPNIHALPIRNDEKLIKRKQDDIFRLLIKHNISLNLMKKYENRYRSLYDALIEEGHILDWIDSFYDEFNLKQRKEWGAVRLQRLFDK